VQTLVVVLLSLNRLTPLALDYVRPNEFMRWVDLNNLALPLVSVIAFWLLKRHIETLGGGPGAATRGAGYLAGLEVAFVAGVYLLAAGYGAHEITNYLHVRFCGFPPVDQTLCDIVTFNDDTFSHYLFFAGLITINVALMLHQAAHPRRAPLPSRDLWLVVANSVFIGLGIFANLAFETIGLDLYVVAVVAAVALCLVRRHGRQPLLVYFAVAYVFGLVATAGWTLVQVG
jgi:hypothetical protein